MCRFRYKSISGREQAFDLLDEILDVFLAVKSDHKEIVTCLKADHSITEEPNAFEQWVAADYRANRKTCNIFGVEDIREHNSTGGERKRSEERCSDPAGNVPLELDTLRIGLRQMAFCYQLFTTREVTVKLIGELLTDQVGIDELSSQCELMPVKTTPSPAPIAIETPVAAARTGSSLAQSAAF